MKMTRLYLAQAASLQEMPLPPSMTSITKQRLVNMLNEGAGELDPVEEPRMLHFPVGFPEAPQKYYHDGMDLLYLGWQMKVRIELLQEQGVQPLPNVEHTGTVWEALLFLNEGKWWSPEPRTTTSDKRRVASGQLQMPAVLG